MVMDRDLHNMSREVTWGMVTWGMVTQEDSHMNLTALCFKDYKQCSFGGGRAELLKQIL